MAMEEKGRGDKRVRKGSKAEIGAKLFEPN
jgi:hypothetical protein